MKTLIALILFIISQSAFAQGTNPTLEVLDTDTDTITLRVTAGDHACLGFYINFEGRDGTCWYLFSSVRYPDCVYSLHPHQSVDVIVGLPPDGFCIRSSCNQPAIQCAQHYKLWAVLLGPGDTTDRVEAVTEPCSTVTSSN